jgi:hypothetical protein
MNSTVVDRIYEDFATLLQILDSAAQPSLRSFAEENLRKSLLLASASFFERKMTEAVLDFAASVTSQGHVLTFLVKNKAVSRQYHTWFSWDTKNANSFFSLFGPEFSERMQETVSNDANLKSSIEAFLEMGRERNRLVHQDFGSFALEKTAAEIYQLYSSAFRFVNWFPSAIANYAAGNVSKDG